MGIDADILNHDRGDLVEVPRNVIDDLAAHFLLSLHQRTLERDHITGKESLAAGLLA